MENQLTKGTPIRKAHSNHERIDTLPALLSIRSLVQSSQMSVSFVDERISVPDEEFLEFFGKRQEKIKMSSATELYNQIQEQRARGQQVLIIDTRSRARFNESHLVGAVSFPFDEITEEAYFAFSPKTGFPVESELLKNRKR